MISVGLAFAVALVSAQTSLDAPLPASAPTIGSEVGRGADAAHSCESISPVRNLLAYEKCIDTAHDENRQAMRTGYEAFDSGLYWSEVFNLNVLVKTLSTQDVLGLRNLADSGLALAKVRYENARDTLKLTDEQVQHAALIH